MPPRAKYLVHPATERWPVGDGVPAVGVVELMRELSA
jgi:hypothetical protein